MTVKSVHKFKGTAEELRVALIKEVNDRLVAVPNYGDRREDRGRMRGEREGLENLLHLLERLEVS